jgi:hypothetical protein
MQDGFGYIWRKEKVSGDEQVKRGKGSLVHVDLAVHEEFGQNDFVFISSKGFVGLGQILCDTLGVLATGQLLWMDTTLVTDTAVPQVDIFRFYPRNLRVHLGRSRFRTKTTEAVMHRCKQWTLREIEMDSLAAFNSSSDSSSALFPCALCFPSEDKLPARTEWFLSVISSI